MSYWEDCGSDSIIWFEQYIIRKLGTTGLIPVYLLNQNNQNNYRIEPINLADS